MDPPTIEEFWQAYCAQCADHTAGARGPDDAWSFGGDERMADALGRLVLRGVKTATTGLVWEHDYFAWKPPAVGAKTVILDGREYPLCIIETTAVRIMPFNAVDAGFARREGEGFESVGDWQRAHWRYFARRCAEIGREPSEEMPVICHEFRVIYPG